MKINKEYIKARDALIPHAERYANEQVGKHPNSKEDREEWGAKWNQVFLAKMDKLAREIGLV